MSSSSNFTIHNIRAAIDDADDILLRALSTRFRALRHLRDIKRQADIQVESLSREKEIKERWKAKAKELDLSPELVLLILDFLLTESKRIQSE